MKVEGKNAVMELLNSTLNVDKILIQDGMGNTNKIFQIARDKHLKVQFVPKAQLDKQSETGNHQGVIAFATDFKYSELEDILNISKNNGTDPFILLLDGIEDPHNFGSIIRTAECVGADGIVIAKNRACPVTETVIKVSTGACFNVPIAQVVNLNDCIRDLKERNIFIYALEADGHSIYQTNLKGAIALVIGSEGSGVSALTRKLSDDVISLPMYGKINSLNASVAAGISLYEAKKQRI